MPASREELHKAVDILPNERLKEALDCLRVLLAEPEELTLEEWEKLSNYPEIPDGSRGVASISEDMVIGLKLDEADRDADSADIRYTHDKVFSRIRAKINTEK